MPTKPIDSDAMKDGILSRTCVSPLRNPQNAPIPSASGIARTPGARRRPAEREEDIGEDNGAHRHRAFHRQVDGAHQDDEGHADGHHQRRRRGDADPGEIADREEARLDQRQQRDQRDQHQNGRPLLQKLTGHQGLHRAPPPRRASGAAGCGSGKIGRAAAAAGAPEAGRIRRI
jgi:hypothetical protein